jgi:hypothetical protein
MQQQMHLKMASSEQQNFKNTTFLGQLGHPKIFSNLVLISQNCNCFLLEHFTHIGRFDFDETDEHLNLV